MQSNVQRGAKDHPGWWSAGHEVAAQVEEAGEDLAKGAGTEDASISGWDTGTGRVGGVGSFWRSEGGWCGCWSCARAG